MLVIRAFCPRFHCLAGQTRRLQLHRSTRVATNYITKRNLLTGERVHDVAGHREDRHAQRGQAVPQGHLRPGPAQAQARRQPCRGVATAILPLNYDPYVFLGALLTWPDDPSLVDHTTVLDLPGTYSLTAYSPEEIIARDYIIEERPDVVINVVDATNLERNLYLTVQLLELDVPVVLALFVAASATAMRPVRR